MSFKFHSVFQNHSSSSGFSFRKKNNKRKKAVATLMLTSLIDAFSILVVYLLMFFSNTGEMTYVSSEIDLPKASAIERLDRYSIIQIRKEGYFIEDSRLSPDRLLSYLVDLKKQLNQSDNLDQKETITIQADKTIPYNRLSPIIQACSHAGFSNIKFAVLGK